MKRNPLVIEHNAQRRARGAMITGPERPVIASRPFDTAAVHDAQAARNARRMADFHARYRGQKAAALQLWRA
jgi:hypothetical protein